MGSPRVFEYYERSCLDPLRDAIICASAKHESEIGQEIVSPNRTKLF
jgi:hypothetical protein